MPGAVRGHDHCGNGSYTFTRTCIDDDSGQTYTETVTVSCQPSEYPCCSPNVYVNYRKAVHLGCTGCDDLCRPLEGSPNVFTNGFPKHRLYDRAQRQITIDTDCDGVDDSTACCEGEAVTASPNVIVNG